MRLLRANWILGLVLFGGTALAQNQAIYNDSLQNGWENWSWATVNLSNASPAHSGAASTSVTAAGWQALYLHHAAFDPTPYTSLRFWINGGTGGQRMNVQATVNGASQAAVALGPLTANTWTQVTIPLSQLGVANNSSFDGFWIQDSTGTTQPKWYIDDAELVAAAAPPSITLQIDATHQLQTIDSRMFSVAAAVWDAAFNTPTTIQYIKDAGYTTSRFPGGSLSDSYHWQTNTTDSNTWTWATSFDAFANVMKQANCNAFITVNYGSGTSDEAAAWVQYSNITKNYGFKYWEIGNENYGDWENDLHTRKHDPYTYANEAANYIAVMKSVDPTIKIGVVAVTGEDSYANFTDHPATNLRTGAVHNGWTPVMLQRMRQLGVTPDFVIYHRYDQGPGNESDSALLQSSTTWPNDVNNLRQQVSDYLGAAGANTEIVCTENNSVYSNPGKQTTSLVNGLFLADSLGQAMKTELKTLVWWDFRNAQETGNNNSSSLYGWRQYGDYGVVSGGNDRYPSYYTARLMQYFARGGDKSLTTNSNYFLMSAYGSYRFADGSMRVLVINKDPNAAHSATVSVTGVTPSGSAAVYSYGIPQDEAARTGVGSPDIAQSTIGSVSSNFTYNFPAYSATVIVINGTVIPPPPPPTVPNPPSALTATAASKTQINLKWTDNATDETGFRVERSTNGTSFTQIATLGANAIAYSSTGLKANTTYYYRVRAFNSAGNSTYSNTASAKTPRR